MPGPAIRSALDTPSGTIADTANAGRDPLPRYRARDLLREHLRAHFRFALVCPGLSGRHFPGLVAGPLRAASRQSLVARPPPDERYAAGGFHHLADRGGRPGRAAGLRAVLPARLLLQPPAGDPGDLAGGHVLPRRVAGRGSGHPDLLRALEGAAAAGDGHAGAWHTTGPDAGPDRQFHQCRALGQTDGCTLGRNLPRTGSAELPRRRRTLRAPPLSAL